MAITDITTLASNLPDSKGNVRSVINGLMSDSNIATDTVKVSINIIISAGFQFFINFPFQLSSSS